MKFERDKNDQYSITAQRSQQSITLIAFNGDVEGDRRTVNLDVQVATPNSVVDFSGTSAGDGITLTWTGQLDMPYDIFRAVLGSTDFSPITQSVRSGTPSFVVRLLNEPRCGHDYYVAPTYVDLDGQLLHGPSSNRYSSGPCVAANAVPTPPADGLQPLPVVEPENSIAAATPVP